jgi:hypothetical protein
MGSLLSFLAGRILNSLPAFLLNRFLPAREVARQIELRLRAENAIVVQKSDVPSIRLFLEITNLSSLELRLDRLLIELWFGQPTLDITIMRRPTLRPHSTLTDLSAVHYFSSVQQRQIEQFEAVRPGFGQIHIYMLA